MRRFDQLQSLLLQVSAAGDPAERLRAVAQLKRELDAVETELAADALRTGLSWSQIGEALGISKQAAHRRHSHGIARLDQAARDQPTGRGVVVSSAARHAVRVARREAAAMGQSSVGTEHLLLGLLQCGDAATTGLLERLGVTLERARTLIQPTQEVPVVPESSGRAAAADSPAAVLSPLARRAVEHALGEIEHHGAEPLSAMDLLRALLREDQGGAARTLEMLSVDPDVVRQEIDRESPVTASPRP